MSVHPGRGISPLWLILRFLQSHLFIYLFIEHGKFVLGTEDVVHCTDCKAHPGNVT